MVQNQIISRFDIYSTVHKGLRAFMTDTQVAVGRLDEVDENLPQVLEQVRSLIEICREHLFHENQFLHPAMEARRPGSACATASDHVEHEQAFESIEGDVLRVERKSGAERRTALLNLYRNLTLFVADKFKYMYTEECVNNEVLWDAYTDDELHQIHASLLAAVSSQAMRANLRWMLPCASHPERLEVLMGAQKTLPTPVFSTILQMIRPNLSNQDWNRLTEALSLSVRQPA
jgi:hypothetical protein